MNSLVSVFFANSFFGGMMCMILPIGGLIRGSWEIGEVIFYLAISFSIGFGLTFFDRLRKRKAKEKLWVKEIVVFFLKAAAVWGGLTTVGVGIIYFLALLSNASVPEDLWKLIVMMAIGGGAVTVLGWLATREKK